MEKHLSIVKVDKRHYRTIARENWGLTKEQMKGMHVHHRIPVSEDGTNDPSNLYVCSPKFHAEVWHDGAEFAKWANEGGTRGGKRAVELGVGIHGRSAEQRADDARKAGKKAAELGVGVHAPGVRSRGGTKTVELGVGIHSPGVVTFETCSKGGQNKPREARVKSGKTTSSQRWQSTDPNYPPHIASPGPLSNWQKARGIDTSLRKRVV